MSKEKSVVQSLVIKTEGATRGIVDLHDGAGMESLCRIESDFRSNTGYTLGYSLLNVGSTGTGCPGTVIGAATYTGGGFTNQPTNDQVEIVSDTVGDTRTVTVYGTINGVTTQIATEVMTLSGTTPVDSVRTNWGKVLGVEVSSASAAVVTISKKTGPATITVILANTTQKGVTTLSADCNSPNCYGLPVNAVASNSTSKVVGVYGLDNMNNAIGGIITLNGTTSVDGSTPIYAVTKVLYGDVEAARTVTFSIANITPGAAQWALGAYTYSNGPLPIRSDHRYLHWCVCNAGALASGGAADWIRVLVMS